MTLVAFSGKLSSGKDTAAARLAAMVDVPTSTITFARPMKESIGGLLDMTVEEWDAEKNNPEAKILVQVGYEQVHEWASDGGQILEQPKIIREFTWRQFIQRYGTEAHREIEGFGDNIWVEVALGNYVPSSTELTMVTDCRFENEAIAVLQRGGVVVHIIGANEETGTHASEVLFNPKYFTHEIVNTIRDDNFANLDSQLKALAGQVGLSLKREVLI